VSICKRLLVDGVIRDFDVAIRKELGELLGRNCLLVAQQSGQAIQSGPANIVKV